MFDWIKDLFTATGTLLSPVVMVRPWQGAVVLRYGRWHRTLTPGYYWKWPFFEDAVWTETCETTFRAEPQSLTTSDDRPVTVSAIVKYEIKDVRKFVCDVWDQRDVLGDVTAGAVDECIRAHTYEELMRGVPDAALLTKVKRGVGKYGFQINGVTFRDRARGRSLRLIMPSSMKDLDN
jgi:membrane protease subunit HflK